MAAKFWRAFSVLTDLRNCYNLNPLSRQDIPLISQLHITTFWTRFDIYHFRGYIKIMFQ